MQRKIIHIDCDCYYAALEVRDFPHLNGMPVAVGGLGPRSVLSTCNYEARAYGVHSAMPTQQAKRLCPSLIIQPHRFEVYRSSSEQIRAIFERYSNKIEPLSLDEAYIDVTGSHWFGGSATLLAEHIRQEIYQELGITVSAGVAPNKFLAKVGSDWNKPNGIFVLPPNDVDEFVKKLSVTKIFGVGKKLYQRLQSLDIETCADLQSWSLPSLLQVFGKTGPWLYQLSRGIDNREVGGDRQRKSLSVEHTYATDLQLGQDISPQIELLYSELNHRMSKKMSLPVRSIFVKVRFSDFSTTTMERAWPITLTSFSKLIEATCGRQSKSIRLLGLGVRFAEPQSEAQMTLWGENEVPLSTP